MSRSLFCHELSIPSISKTIAIQLARLHQLNVPIFKETNFLCETMTKWLLQLKTMPDAEPSYVMFKQYLQWAPNEVTVEDLIKEVENLRQLLYKTKSPIVFCHNDLQEGNILIVDERLKNGFRKDLSFLPKLVFVDFEYASYNFRGFDFANHFVEFSINYNVDVPPFYELLPENFPNNDQMFEFMRNYLNEQRVKSDLLEDMAKGMVSEALSFVPVSHLFWGILDMVKTKTSSIKFNYSDYGRDRIGLYFKTRKLLKLMEIPKNPEILHIYDM